MKKFLALALCLLFLLLFSGCRQPRSDDNVSDSVPEASPVVNFSEYLNSINLHHSLSQWDFVDQVETYSYNGTKVTDICVGCHYDTYRGGGWVARGDSFYFRNSFDVKEYVPLEYAIYGNSLYTEVPLEGLAMPCEIEFDDTLPTVVEKLNIEIDPKSEFGTEGENSGRLILYSDDFATIQLTDCNAIADDPSYLYELEYTERYQYAIKGGRSSYVTRYVCLSFDEGGKLSRLDASVEETYRLN